MLHLLEKYLIWTRNQTIIDSIDSTEEKRRAVKFQEFYNPEENQFDRNHIPGHFTGSALIVNPNFTRVLLTLHAKLNLWLQLGGHADGDRDIAAVALREAQEESGLCSFSFVDLQNFDLVAKNNTLTPFDIDSHLIPQTQKEQEHYHYDVAFLLMADDTLPLQITHESTALQWFTLKEAKAIATEERLQRMFTKIEALRANFESRQEVMPSSGLDSQQQ